MRDGQMWMAPAAKPVYPPTLKRGEQRHSPSLAFIAGLQAALLSGVTEGSCWDHKLNLNSADVVLDHILI